MRLIQSRDLSIDVTCALMKSVGIWLATNQAEQKRRNLALMYTTNTIIVITIVAMRDIYFSWGNVSDCIFVTCNILYLAIVLFKIAVLYTNKTEFFELVRYTQKHFWHWDYDADETLIQNECRKMCRFFIIIITFCCLGVCNGYMVTPLIENIGKNETQKILPFNMWLDYPVGRSPCYETLFTMQMLCVYHVGICYICFDNFLCLLNLQIATQFRILQHRLHSLTSIVEAVADNEESLARVYHEKLAMCVRRHQELIEYCKHLENIFTKIILGQMLFLSLVLCLVGYQLFLLDTPPSRTIALVINLCGTQTQLLMYTYTCDGIIRQSLNVSKTALSGPWPILPMNRVGRLLRKSVLLMILRSNQHCCLTASGFFQVSLETYTSVLSTAMSYFTLLRQQTVDKAMLQDPMTKEDISITLSSFLLKWVGCWLAETDGERRLSAFAVVNTFAMLIFSIYIDVTDMYHSLDDIDNFLYVAANFLMSVTALLKYTLLYRNKLRFLKLVIYTRTYFWDVEYNEDEQVYVESARKFFTFVIIVTYGCVSYLVLSYICIPFYETVTGNGSVRVFPLRMWPVLGMPVYDTPYFEILFVVQAVCCLQIGIAFVSLDNFLILVNTHTASQFQILQHRLLNLSNASSKQIGMPDYADRCYRNLKACIQQHQMLIEYCIRAEAVFSFNILMYVVVFGVGTCLSLYQALLGNITIERRISFVFYVAGIILQLILITHSCGCMITESANVGPVAYATLWPVLSTNRSGRMLRRDVHMVILRSQKPCQLTAGGFFPVSLETSTKLISTAVSYFTLLKQTSES
ncbi:uncharacterized protein LOC144467733 [Augochlora pura]